MEGDTKSGMRYKCWQEAKLEDCTIFIGRNKGWNVADIGQGGKEKREVEEPKMLGSCGKDEVEMS